MALGAPGLAAIGGIFRNYRGFSKGSFCKAIGVQNAFFAELLAFITAVDIAWHKGWFKIWFEMDSLTLVTSIQNDSFQPPWPLLIAWQNCQQQLTQFQYHISHVFREGNQVADALTKQGLSHSTLKWWPSHPDNINRLLAHDYGSFPNYRFKGFG